MATDTSPLDERVFSEPMANVWYMGQLPNSEFHFPFMDHNMLHHYFSKSPFFDWTTKNGLEIQQCQQDRYGWEWSHDRHKFEAQIAARNGEEYMIVEGEGMEFDADGKPTKGGVWVMRKQDRVKGAAGKGKDAVETLATYYLVGENVYQAPSVGDILGTRLLSASTALSKCFSQAATLPQWSPTTGHTYPTTTSATITPGSRNPTSTTTSTPSRSRSASLAADTSFRSASSGPAGPFNNTTSTASSNALANRLLRDSLKQSFTYADDPLTDENPLLGEPGSLTFASSTHAAKKRKTDAEAAALKAREKEAQEQEALVAAVAAAAAEASKPATPVVALPTTPGGKVVKKVKKEKRRRKSKGGAGGSPLMSPAGGNTPAASPGPGS